MVYRPRTVLPNIPNEQLLTLGNPRVSLAFVFPLPIHFLGLH